MILKDLCHARYLELFLATYKITFQLKETLKCQFTEIEKHQRDSNKP